MGLRHRGLRAVGNIGAQARAIGQRGTGAILVAGAFVINEEQVVAALGRSRGGERSCAFFSMSNHHGSSHGTWWDTTSERFSSSHGLD